MSYQLTGTIKMIGDVQTFASGFSKRDFVVITEERFPQEIKLECLKEKASLLDSLAEGQRVTVHFDIGGREYNGRHFVNLNAWKIETADADGSAPAADASEEPIPEDTTDYTEKDDIPF